MSDEKPQNYRNLRVWQEALGLVPEIYGLARRLPPYEQFAFSDQLRRAVSSVPSNIAEGQGRHYPKEFARYLCVARGSLAEIDTLLYAAERLGYANEEECSGLRKKIDFIRTMINSLLRTLKIRE